MTTCKFHCTTVQEILEKHNITSLGRYRRNQRYNDLLDEAFRKIKNLPQDQWYRQISTIVLEKDQEKRGTASARRIRQLDKLIKQHSDLVNKFEVVDIVDDEPTEDNSLLQDDQVPTMPEKN